jgi:rare lipoprotein A
MKVLPLLCVSSVLLLVGCGATSQRPVTPRVGGQEEGLASWYGGKFQGRKTASGELFDQNAFTAAHRTMPFGTKLRVTNRKNGRSVKVRVNDRGPFSGRQRVIDLSKAAADAIGMTAEGIVPVRIEVLSVP